MGARGRMKERRKESQRESERLGGRGARLKIVDTKRGEERSQKEQDSLCLVSLEM